jgi:hypothetical protein
MRIHKISLVALVALAIFVLGRTPVSAQILIYDNGAPVLGTFSFNADSGDPSGLTMAGNVFTATNSGNAGLISFAGSYKFDALPSSDHFVLSLYSVSGDAPAALLGTSTLSAVSRTYIGQGSTHADYTFGAVINTPLAFAAGTQYYLGLSDVGDGEDFGFGLTANPLAATNEQSLLSGSFNADTGSLSFALAVPEPSEYALLVVSGLGLFFAKKLRLRLVSK